jgi:integrase
LRTFTTESARVVTVAELREVNCPLGDVIESFFRANYDLSPKTERWYRQNLAAFCGFVLVHERRPALLQDVNKAMVDAFLKWRRTKPTRKYPDGSPFAVRAAAVTLKRLATFLAADGILGDQGRSVLRHVKRGKVDDDVRRPLSDIERDSIIDAASHLGVVPRAVCVLGFGSGLRLNELREARVTDLDLGRGEFNVRPETSKFGKGRTVFLHPAVVSDVDRYLRNRSTSHEPEAPLFPTRSGDPFSGDGFSKLFQRVHRASRVRTFSAHLMRHTWATNFMRVPGASLLELKRQGGWQRWEQVERYSHAVPHHDRRTLPNPLSVQKTAFGQSPSTRVSRLSIVG